MKKLITFIMLLICVISLNAQNNSLEQNLVAYLPFNGDANDESWNYNSGQVNNARLTSDRFNNKDNAYEFYTESSYINIPSSPSLNTGPEVTICGWFYPKDSTTKEQCILIHGDEDNGSSERINWCIQKLFVTNHCGNSYKNQDKVSDFNVGSEPLELNEWHFFVAIFDYSLNKELFYLDGNVVGTYSYKIYDPGNPYYHQYFQIGGRKQPEMGSYNSFNGKIDDIRLYNRKLSLDEINLLYKEGIPTEGQTTSINIKTVNKLKIYPNPTVNFLKIEGVDVKNIEIFNSLGNKVLNTTVDNIDVSSLSNGIYFIKIYDNDNKITTNKFIKN